MDIWVIFSFWFLRIELLKKSIDDYNKITNQINVSIMCLKTFNYTIIISQLFRDILCQCAKLENFAKCKAPTPTPFSCYYQCLSVSPFLFLKVFDQEVEIDVCLNRWALYIV